MIAFLVRRLAVSALLVLLVLTLTFFVIQLAPGDPAAIYVDPRVPADYLDELRAVHGLDRPLAERYAVWLRAVALEGDWGVSFLYSAPVTSVILRHLPPTLLLTGTALAIQIALGLALGVGAARRAGGGGDHAIRIGSLLLYSTPAFWLALMALLLFSHTWPLFPPGGSHSVGSAALQPAGRLLDRLHHLALPALVLGVASAGYLARFLRNSLLDVLHQDYIRTARAKGLRERTVVWVHALRNALAPVTQLVGLSLPFLISGALVVEVVFAWPGTGRLVFDAVRARDYPLVLAATALAAVFVVAGNILADLLLAWIDPRIRDAR